MEGKAFDQVIQRLSTSFSRREIWKGLTRASLGVAVVRFPIAAEAKKKRRRKKKNPKLKLNAFQCVDVGQACRGDSANCCSGVCQGKKPKKGKKDTSRCIAHNTGECVAEQDTCQGVTATCGTDGVCFQTTGRASFCGSASKAESACAECARDTDCEADFGSGAACIVCEGACALSGATNVCIRTAA